MRYRDAIRRAREAANIKQGELAEMVGWSQSRISNYENGIREPGQDDLLRIAKALNLSLGEMLGLTETGEEIVLTQREKEHILALRSLSESNQEKLFEIYHHLIALQDKA